MGISKKYLDHNQKPLRFSIDKLADKIKNRIPEAVFVYLHGSAAAEGVVNPHSDIDIAVYTDGEADLNLYSRISEICSELIGEVRCDLGIVNNAEPVYCFEVLKGKLLFTRDEESWLKFYSRTCREYESVMFHYEKQRRLRLESQNAV